MSIDFAALAARLLQQSRSYLEEWFPEGKYQGHEFCVGDLSGSPGESLKININTGKWKDFASGEAGGDLISLYAAMHGLNQPEAARKLDGDGSIVTRVPPRPAAPVAKREEWSPVMPVPDDAGKPSDDYYRKGPGGEWVKLQFKARWGYTDAEGRTLGYAVRFEWYEGAELHKDIVPQVFAESGEGKRQWRWRSFADPRPLYNQAELARRPEAPVIVVEGEKKVDAIRIIAPQYVGVAWPGGSGSWRKADWSILKGRSVLCWPDADRKVIRNETESKKYKLPIGNLIPRDSQPGMKAMWEIGHSLLKICPTVKVIIPEGVEVDGWDAADAVAEGWDWKRFKAWAVPRLETLTEGEQHGRKRTDDSDRSDSPPQAGSDVSEQRDTGGSRRDAAAAPVTAGNVGNVQADDPGRADAQGQAIPVDRFARSSTEGQRSPDRRSEDGSRGGDSSAKRSIGQASRPDGGVQSAPSGEIASPGETIQASESSAASAPQSQIGRWLAWGLDRSGNGLPLTNLNNAVRVLEADPALRSLVWFDEFLQRMMTGDPAREWADADDIHLTLYMQRELGLSKIGRDTVGQAVIAIAFRDVRNCVRDYTDKLKHDGTPRIDQFLTRVFGCDDNDYSRAASRNFWVSMVARIYRPGCKVDNMIVLEGSQGLHKSSALAAIADPWFAEQHESAANPKAFAEVLQGKLLIEVAEMDSFSRSEVNTIKKVVSCQSDRFRASYARYAKDHPRQGIMAGSTNKDDWNRDETGARRFWPISCRGMADIGYCREHRDQLFAEAVVAFLAGDKWWEMPGKETLIEQRKRYDADPWIEPISIWLLGRASATANEIADSCLRIEMNKIDRGVQMRIASVLRALGWTNTGNRKLAGKVRKVWEPGSDLYGQASLGLSEKGDRQENDRNEVATNVADHEAEREVATDRSLPQNDIPFQ